MLHLYRVIALTMLLLASGTIAAQTILKGKVIDAATREPVSGASLNCTDAGCHCGCISENDGSFTMNCKNCHTVVVSSVGYLAARIFVTTGEQTVSITPSQSLLDKVVVSANRGAAVKRSEAPVAISAITSKTIQETKAITADQLLNKVSGVNMVSLGNEQHQMSIRQPMTTKSLFLYLEDGIPIRTTGLYNHNALLEMNLAATKTIEVIKGPSSSLYGSEAIGGVVNFITQAPTAVPVSRLSLQGNDIGYRRAEVMTAATSGKAGFVVSGYYAAKKNGYLEYNDFHKGIITGRFDYRFSEKTALTNSVSWLNYNSDMSGGIDSAMFASKTFKNMHTFTYREVRALRYRSSLVHSWNDRSRSTLSVLYRSNAIAQNPAYRVKDDYRRLNGNWTGNPTLAHGEINESRFKSYSVIAQHRQAFDWKKAVLQAGAAVDLSPSAFDAGYIRIKKDTARTKYISYEASDSVLSKYTTRLNNYAAFVNFEFSPAAKLRVVGSLRYDVFRYTFDNALTPSAFTGAADTANTFARMSPKIGFTYNFSSRTGIYANYSEGFVPPQVSEMYTGVKVPNIKPSVFSNYEIGGWMQIVPGRLSADISVYQLDGSNEIVSVKQDDGSYINQNAGRTSHKGVELGIQATPVAEVSFRLSGAYSRHRFIEFAERGEKFDGNDMHNAPEWVYNAELWYRPLFVEGLRVGLELQHVGSYFVDAANSARYKGYDVLHFRSGYEFKSFELWLNILNVTNSYYSNITTKSAFGYSYQVAEPINFNVGFAVDIAELFKKEKP